MKCDLDPGEDGPIYVPSETAQRSGLVITQMRTGKVCLRLFALTSTLSIRPTPMNAGAATEMPDRAPLSSNVGTEQKSETE